jgi:hypothetical protein
LTGACIRVVNSVGRGDGDPFANIVRRGQIGAGDHFFDSSCGSEDFPETGFVCAGKGRDV